VLSPEQLLRPIDRQVFQLVAVDITRVVALSRVALGVLVREHRTGRFEHTRRGVVLARDHLERFDLAHPLILDDGGNGRVSMGKHGHGNSLAGVVGPSRVVAFIQWRK